MNFDNSSQKVLHRYFGQEYSEKDLRRAAKSSLEDLQTSHTRKIAYSQAKVLVESAI